MSAIHRIKTRVRRMIHLRNRRAPANADAQPSAYWRFFTDAFDYLDALPAAQFDRLRLHTYHIDGSTYQTVFFSRADHFRACVRYLRRFAPCRYWLSAPERCGEYGHMVDGGLVNDSVIRWQRLVNSLYDAGVIAELERRDRPVFLEIGAGYGSLAHQMHSVFPNALYVIVDLPETLLYSASYLSLIHGANRVRLLSPDERLKPADGHDTSFLLVPHFLLDRIDGFRFDLAMNIMSFQEMSAAQIRRYLSFISRRADRFLSWNHDRNHMSDERVSVPALLREAFSTRRRLPAYAPGPLIQESLYHVTRPVRLKRRPRIFIFGAGAAGQACARTLRTKCGYDIAGFIDNNRSRWDSTLLERRIHPPVRLREHDWDLVMIASVHHADIVTQLEAMGFEEIDDFAVYEEFTYPLKIRRYDPLMRMIADERVGRVLALQDRLRR